MITTLLFDFDGTLVDSEVIHFRCWQEVLTPFGVFFDEERFCQLYSGKPTLASAFDVVAKHNLDANPETLAQQKNALFAKVVKNELPPLMPYAKDVLYAAKAAGFTLALVTGSTRDEVTPILEGYGFTDLFETVVCKDDVTNPKPHPEPYLLALSRLGVDARHGVALEDTSTGSRSAKDARLCVYAIPNKYTQEQDFAHVDEKYDDLLQMYTHLTKTQFRN